MHSGAYFINRLGTGLCSCPLAGALTAQTFTYPVTGKVAGSYVQDFDRVFHIQDTVLTTDQINA
jgi:hypothetical protein